MSVPKIGLLFIWAWCCVIGARWLLGSSIDFAHSLITAVLLTGGIMIGDRYQRRQQIVTDQSQS